MVCWALFVIFGCWLPLLGFGKSGTWGLEKSGKSMEFSFQLLLRTLWSDFCIGFEFFFSLHFFLQALLCSSLDDIVFLFQATVRELTSILISDLFNLVVQERHVVKGKWFERTRSVRHFRTEKVTEWPGGIRTRDLSWAGKCSSYWATYRSRSGVR